MSDPSSGSGTAAPTDPIVDGYARAIVAVADAEGALERVEDELFRFGRAVQEHPELRDRLVDPALEAATKLGIVTDLLGDRAHPQTLTAISLVVQAGRSRQLPQIADAVVERAAQSRAQAVVEVRSAVALSTEQERRLATALARVVGGEVDLKVIVDPSVVGGVVVRIGDTVIDGSLARRLTEVRSQLTGA